MFAYMYHALMYINMCMYECVFFYHKLFSAFVYLSIYDYTCMHACISRCVYKCMGIYMIVYV